MIIREFSLPAKAGLQNIPLSFKPYDEVQFLTRITGVLRRRGPIQIQENFPWAAGTRLPICKLMKGMAITMDKILIVDDEPDIVNLLTDYFQMNGYMVMTALCGAQALEQVEKGPDIILLDINMPDIDGLSVCAKIREYVTCPILFLTAKITETDQINGFHVGGDDYILKPFRLEELGARVAAHLRREMRKSGKTKAKFIDDLVIDYGKRTVSFQGTPLTFTKKEFDIIELLSMHRGQIFDKERIYESVWGWDSEGDSAVVAEHIRRIRAKLNAVSGKNYIETVWGVGYQWA